MDKEVYSEGYVDVKSLSPNWVTENFLSFMNLGLEDCKGKNITSIGGGFGIFEMDAAKAGAIVTAVDPIFKNEESINLKLKENIERLGEKTKRDFENGVEATKSSITNLLLQCDDVKEKHKIKDRLDWYQARQTEIHEYLRRRKVLLKHLDSWKEDQSKSGLILNSSSGDHIEGIDSKSQDMVVIGHTLSHIYREGGKIKDFLKEALRILKNGGKIWIIDYLGDNREFENILANTEKKEYYKEIKGSFGCCFNKEGLLKFIETELKD